MNQLQEARTTIEEAQKKVNELLKQTPYVHSLLNINAHFTQLLTKMKFMGAAGVDADPVKDKEDRENRFPPITNFMGEEIKVTKKITNKDIEVSKKEKDDFLAKRDKLYDSFETMTTPAILKSFVTAEDIIVLRSVAKKAGVTGFKERELDEILIEEIRDGIKKNKVKAAAILKAEEGAGKAKAKGKDNAGNGEGAGR